MTKKAFTILSGVKATIVAGVFLVGSLILMLTGMSPLVDPAWVTIVICGFPLLYLAFTRLIYNKGMSKISSALLISIAMFACIGLNFSQDSDENLFAAGEVAFIMSIGAILEEKTVDRAKKGLKRLISLAPEQGRVIRGGTEEMLPIEQVKVGDALRVLPGEMVPVDGVIIVGDTSVDQSIITGESLPVDKSVGDSVFCGTMNRFGAIDISAAKVGADSSLQKLIRMVQDAENNKAPMQRIVDKWAAWLVPIALLIAIGTYFATQDIVRAVTILVVFCPCALALATPTSIMAAIGQATKHGVIIKSGDALERMGKVDCVAFDKTGTLTTGNIAVSDAISFDEGISETELVSFTASAEAYSEHPLGKAVVVYAKEKKISLLSADDFKMLPGKGITASVNGRRIMCGNSAWLETSGVTFGGNTANTLARLRLQGKATIIVALDGKCVGVIALSDTLRLTAKDMVRELKNAQTNAVLLTGDHRQTAEYFAKQVGIDAVYAELLPEDKVAQIRKIQEDGTIVAMIGDGVNDAPALKAATVGVAMGSMGSDIAVDAADIALMGDDIAKIPYLKRLSNATVKLIKFNISLSMVINFIAIILSVLAVLNPITGALVHNVGSVLVVLNAALLYDRKYA
jgi:heavy metal translocating P-type ATPase